MATAKYIGVDGLSRKIRDGFFSPSGTARKIAKGYVGISGVAMPFWGESGGNTLADIPIETLIRLDVGGSPYNWLTVQQGNPDPSLYDASFDDGSMFMMENLYNEQPYDAGDYNSYQPSDINIWLNGDFLNLLDFRISSKIKEVKIPFVNGPSTAPVATGTNGLSVKTFLPSMYEVGITQSDATYIPAVGSKLDYFLSGIGAEAKTKRIAYLNSEAKTWWSRDPIYRTGNNQSAWEIDHDGGVFAINSQYSYGVRPVLCLRQDTEVEEEPNADGSYNLIL